MVEYGLDIGAEVAYARRWAYGRNPQFYDFEELGGDCTNFVSQCIFAGGAVMNFTPDVGWYYRSLGDRAAAWTGVEYFYRFMVGNRGVGPFGHEVRLRQVRAGDVIQLGHGGQFYHSLFVVGVRRGEPLVAAHSYDVFGRGLWSYAFQQVRCLRVDRARRW